MKRVPKRRIGLRGDKQIQLLLKTLNQPKKKDQEASAGAVRVRVDGKEVDAADGVRALVESMWGWDVHEEDARREWAFTETSS